MNEESLLKTILGEAREKIQEEVGGLLGRTLTLEPPRIKQISKDAAFAEASRKLVLTRIAIDGDLDGEMFLFTPLRDAILLGGTLIMLPSSELDTRIKKEEFGEEENDAFGEIVNIVSGVINALCDEYYPKKLRLKKTALQPLNSAKVDPNAAEPFPPQTFLQGTFAMKFEEQSLGSLDILFPALLFPVAVAPASVPESVPAETIIQEPEPAAAVASSQPLVLILAEQGCDTTMLTTALRVNAFEPAHLGIQDDARKLLREKDVRGIFLVMREVTEHGFAAAIRVRSAAREGLPLIAIGPQWTRNSVLQAVKFGIRDILVAPATDAEIQEKITSHLLA